MSPTTGWWRSLVPVSWKRTLWAAQRTRSSALWVESSLYRGIEPADDEVMGHEYVSVVEEIGSDVKTMKVGDFTPARSSISPSHSIRPPRATRRCAPHVVGTAIAPSSG